jgi:hypothetical protein
MLYIWVTNRKGKKAEKADVWLGPLALMVLKTLETIGPLHGHGLEQISDNSLSLVPWT